jgi:hypothetical protein
MPSSPGSSDTQVPLPPGEPGKKPPSSDPQTATIRDNPKLLGITPDHIEAAAQQYERACKAVTQQSLDYALDLLFTSCRLDPLTALYRRKLREVGRLMYRRKGSGSWWSAWRDRSRFRAARRSGDVRAILEAGERVLLRTPVDVRTQQEMAEDCDRSGLRWLAIWLLEQARLLASEDLSLLRALAKIYEAAREIPQAIHMWEQIRDLAPGDAEASRKLQNLAVFYTLNKGRYRS